MNYLYHNIDINVNINNRVKFTVCESIQVKKSVEVLTNTATLVLPREFRNALSSTDKDVDLSNKSILEFISKGDPIRISFGYDGNLETEFRGYIKSIGADAPLVLECEDEMYQLRKANRVTKTISSGKLLDILKQIIPDKYEIVCNETYQIGKWIIKDATPYDVLAELQEKVGLRFNFIDAKTLMVGMMTDFKPDQVHEFNFSRNVRRESDLKFVINDDSPRQIIVESMQKNGEKLSYTTGDPKGESKTKIVFPNLTKEELKKWGDSFIKQEKIGGLKGTLDSWCEPRTNPGDSAQITRPIYSDGHQDGTYFIKAVTIDVNQDVGIKRSNELSHKLI